MKTEKRRDIIVVGEPSRPPTTTILPSALSPRPNEAAQGPSCEAVAGCCRRRCGDGGDACKARASSRRRGSAQPTRLVEGGLGGRARPQPASVALCLPPSLSPSPRGPPRGRKTSSRKHSPGAAVSARPGDSRRLWEEKRSPRRRIKEGRRPTAVKGQRRCRAAPADGAPCPRLPRLPQPRTRRRGTLRRRRRAPEAYLTYGGKPSPDATRARRSRPAAPLLPSPSSPSVRRPRGRGRRRRPTSTMLQKCSRSLTSFACCSCFALKEQEVIEESVTEEEEKEPAGLPLDGSPREEQ